MRQIVALTGVSARPMLGTMNGSRERWGTYAVDDHTDARFLANEVLLYDKLVLPVPSSEQERTRWRENEWDPDLLDRRLEQLRGLAHRRYWNEAMQMKYREVLDGLRKDVGQIERMEFAATRRVLKQEEEVRLGRLPADEDEWRSPTRAVLSLEEAKRLGDAAARIRVVAAFRSPAEFVAASSPREKHDRVAAQLTLLVGHELLSFDGDREPEDLLQRAIDLARDVEFQRKRRAYYDWQEDAATKVLSGAQEPSEALEEMRELVDEYNSIIKRAAGATRRRCVYTIAAAAAGAGLAALAPEWGERLLALAGAAVPVVQFLDLDRKPELQAGRAEPAAMFHVAASLR